MAVFLRYVPILFYPVLKVNDLRRPVDALCERRLIVFAKELSVYGWNESKGCLLGEAAEQSFRCLRHLDLLPSPLRYIPA